jgi:predicted NBD/HSP70 family sugar kinase
MTAQRKTSRRGGIAPYIASRINLRDLGSSRRVLCLLEESGPTSQIKAASKLGLSPGTCNLHFQRLEHEGLIRRLEHVRKGRGRPTVVWGTDGERNFCASLIFDVPFFQGSLTDFTGMVVHQRRTDLTGLANQRDVLARMDAFVKEATREVKGRDGKLRQVFAAFPGLLDPVTGAVRKAVNLPAIDGLDAQQRIESRHELPCYAGSLGLAYYYGETESVSPTATVMVVHWDLGVGVVTGRNDHVLTMSTGNGGQDMPKLTEMGHMRIVRDGRLCHCGNRGCLEAYTGGAAIIEELERPDIRGLDDLVRLAVAGDSEVLKVARRAARLLGRHLAWAIQFMGVQRIRVTGPMAPVFDRVLPAFESGLAVTFDPGEVARLDTQASRDPQASMQRGAYRLGKRLFFHPEDYQRLPRAPSSLER